MEKLIINGGTPLRGKVQISGMKNAALPIVVASLLTNDVCVIENLPSISDVTLTLTILEKMGCRIRMLTRDRVGIDSRPAVCGSSPVELVSKMRGSTYLLGAELGRWNKTKVGYQAAAISESGPSTSTSKPSKRSGGSLCRQRLRNGSRAAGLHGSSAIF